MDKQAGRAVLTAVDGVWLAVGGGEVVALVGESGCGKSTPARVMLATVICGPVQPAAGRVRFGGIRVGPLADGLGRLPVLEA